MNLKSYNIYRLTPLKKVNKNINIFIAWIILMSISYSKICIFFGSVFQMKFPAILSAKMG